VGEGGIIVGKFDQDHFRLLRDYKFVETGYARSENIMAAWPGLPLVNAYAGELKSWVDAHYQHTNRSFADDGGLAALPPPPWLLDVLERRPDPADPSR
jgi:hypothetical protein